jgi:hypothetical protein
VKLQREIKMVDTTALWSAFVDGSCAEGGGTVSKFIFPLSQLRASPSVPAALVCSRDGEDSPGTAKRLSQGRFIGGYFMSLRKYNVVIYPLTFRAAASSTWVDSKSLGIKLFPE